MWHYVENGQQVGPMTAEQLAQLLAAGKINSDTLVWQPGQKDWRPYRDFFSSDGQPSPENSPASAQAETVCAECGKLFPLDETIRHGNVRICATCKPVFLQKLAEGARINTGALNLAGIGTRFAAVFLDGLMLGAINIGINLIAGIAVIPSAAGQPKVSPILQLVLFAIQVGIGMSYETFFIGKYGATLGKMACKIKVVTADGGRVTYARACGRYFAKMLSFLTCMIGYIMACFDEEKRALHDRICNTRVVLK